MQNQPSLSAAPSNPAARRRGGSREQRYEQLTKQTHTALLTQPIAALAKVAACQPQDRPLHPETLTQVQLPADWIVDEEILRALAFNAAFVDQIRPVHDRQCLAHVVVGNQNRQPGLAQVYDNLLHIVNCDRIDATERLIQHEQLRMRYQ